MTIEFYGARDQNLADGVVIFDIDGTMANCAHRQHHLDGVKKNWKRFFDDMVLDTVYHEIRLLSQALSAYDRVHVFFCTGRPSNYYEQTNRWLNNQGIRRHGMLMRREGDFRADTIVKAEMLQELRNRDFKVLLSIDDRPEVVAMWRNNGVPCLQVDPVTWKRELIETNQQDPAVWLNNMVAVEGSDPMYRTCLDELERLRAAVNPMSSESR